MRRKRVSDTDDIELGEVDINDLITHMYDTINATTYALRQETKIDRATSSLLADLLEVFITTNKSMLLLMDERVTTPVMAADAISLTREQVEKIYTIALLVDDHKRWFRQYLRNSWKKMLERYLLNKLEHGFRPRFQDYVKNTPNRLDKLRRVPKPSGRGIETIVSKKMERAVKYRFNNRHTKKYFPGTRNRQWPKYFDEEEYNNYFLFPTPGKSIRFIRNDSIAGLLVRWYKEYEHLSGYSHIALDKVFLQSISRNNHMETSATIEKMRRTDMENAAFISCTAAATACAEVSLILKNSYGAVEQLKDFWEILSKTSLLAKQLRSRWVETLLA